MQGMQKTTTVAVALTGLVIAACGSSKNNNQPSEADADAARVKFAQCMRAAGVDIPDPATNGGGIQVKIPRGIRPQRMQQIDAGCRRSSGLDKALPKPSAQQQAAISEGALKFSACMRSHGINVPDPQVNGGRVLMRMPRNLNPNTPRFRNAQAACAKLMPGGRAKGPGGGGPGPLKP